MNRLVGKGATGETSGSCGDSLTWSIDTSTGVLTISGSGSMTSYSESAEKWGGHTVKYVSFADPVGITSIGAYAFSGCTELTTFTIPSTVTNVYSFAFKGDTGLTTVSIPKNTTMITPGAFDGCTSLNMVIIDSGNAKFSKDGAMVLYKPYDKFNELFLYPAGTVSPDCTVPSSIHTIGDYAFGGCDRLETVTLSDGVYKIANYAFADCKNLRAVTIPESVEYLYVGAFYGCSSLTSVSIPGSVYMIQSSAFQNCTALETVTIGNGAGMISYSAFRGCTALTSVSIPSSVTSIGETVFMDCTSLISIEIPDAVKTIGNRPFYGCTSLKSISVSASNAYFSSADGCLYDKAGTKLIACPGGLKTYTAPTGLASVETQSFNGNVLRNVNFPAGITITLGSGSFDDCTSLTRIGIEDGANVTFETDSIRFSDGNEHTVYVVAPEGYTLDTSSYSSNIKVVYGEPPSDGGNNPVLLIAVAALAGVGAAFGVLYYLKMKNGKWLWEKQ